MVHSFPKSVRLKKRYEYQRLQRIGKRLTGNCLKIEVQKRNSETTRLGLTVSKKFGDAVERNRFKRLVREAFRLSYSFLPKGLDVNVRPRDSAHKATLAIIREELHDLLKIFSQNP